MLSFFVWGWEEMGRDGKRWEEIGRDRKRWEEMGYLGIVHRHRVNVGRAYPIKSYQVLLILLSPIDCSIAHRPRINVGRATLLSPIKSYQILLSPTDCASDCATCAKKIASNPKVRRYL